MDELIEFYSTEPFGVVRDDLRSGILAAMTYNANRTKKTQDKLTEWDFVMFSNIPKLRREKRKRGRSKAQAAFARAERLHKERMKERGR